MKRGLQSKAFPREDRVKWGYLGSGQWYDFMSTPNHIITLVGMDGWSAKIYTSNESSKPVKGKQHGKEWTKDIEITCKGRWIKVELDAGEGEIELQRPRINYLGRSVIA